MKPITLTLVKTDRAHSTFSASAAKRWLQCPSSIKLQKGLKGSTSPAAEKGTLMHRLAEVWLEQGEDKIKTLMGKSINKVQGWAFKHGPYEVTAEMIESVRFYVDYIAALKAEHGESNVWVEVKVDYSNYLDDRANGDAFGTADCVCLTKDNSTLIVADFKTGKWPVVVENNSQLKVYALGVYRGLPENIKRDIKTVRLAVAQNQSINVWDAPMDEVLSWGYIELYEASMKAMETDLDKGILYVAKSDECTFCKAKNTTCPLKETEEATSEEVVDEAVMAEVMSQKAL
jgi:hypothetical protein